MATWESDVRQVFPVHHQYLWLASGLAALALYEWYAYSQTQDTGSADNCPHLQRVGPLAWTMDWGSCTLRFPELDFAPLGPTFVHLAVAAGVQNVNGWSTDP